MKTLVALIVFAVLPGGADAGALVHAEKARVLTVDHKYREALVEWKEAIRLAPANALFHNLYGLALEQSGQADAAQREFRRALHFKADFADAQSNLANSLWQSHKNQQAALETDRAIRLLPTDASLYLLRGQLYALDGNQSAACHEFGMAEPWPPEPEMLRTVMDNCDGDLRDQALVALVEAYLARCDSSKALVALRLFDLKGKYEYQVRDLRGSALLASGHEAEAETEFHSLVSMFPDLPSSYVAATQVALLQHRWNDAIDILNSGLVRIPENWLLLFRRGVVYKLSGRLDLAKTDFVNALKNGGEVALVAAALGDLEAESGNLRGAADLFNRTWQETKLPQFEFAYALALDRLGESQAALAELRQTERNSPRDAQVHYTLGKILSRDALFKEAEYEFEQARGLAPDLAVNLYALAHAYLAQGKTAQAKEAMGAFQKAKLRTDSATCKPL